MELEQAAVSIFTLARMMRENISQGNKSPGSSLLQIKTLSIISEIENASMKDIAERLCITSPSATAIVERLVKGGDLKREKDPNDRRIIRMQVTAKGKKVLDTGLKKASKKMKEVLDHLTETERKTFFHLLEKIIIESNDITI